VALLSFLSRLVLLYKIEKIALLIDGERRDLIVQGDGSLHSR
jgi:hypothetical protein